VKEFWKLIDILKGQGQRYSNIVISGHIFPDVISW